MGIVGGSKDSEGWSTNSSSKLPLLSLNHVSFVCKSVSESVRFYQDVLGFVLIKRPSSFNFEGAWLFNYGIGIHFLESDNIPAKKGRINPKDNHISFECSDMSVFTRKLEEMNIEYVTAVVKEGGIVVDQLFFHDPDGYMVEICNCQNLPPLPISSCPLKLSPPAGFTAATDKIPYEKKNRGMQCSGEAARLMLENLEVELFNFSI